MTDCGTSAIAVSFASSLAFDTGGLEIDDYPQLSQTEQTSVASSLKDELSNWIIIGSTELNTENCAMHCKITPRYSDEGDTLLLSFFNGSEITSQKVAEGTAYPDTNSIIPQFNSSGITINVKWSGVIPRDDILYVYYQVQVGEILPEQRDPTLFNVETVIASQNGNTVGTDGSDSKSTMNSIYANSLSFGNLASGEISETLIIYLHVPTASAITNIKLGLIDAGGIELASNTFGAESTSYLDYNIVPSAFFTGLNETDEPSDPFNIAVGNREYRKSDYVYLNTTLPEDQDLGTGVITLKWYFDYE